MNLMLTTPEGFDWAITAAREAYNLSLPQEVPVEGVMEPNPDLIGTNENYVSFVLSRAIHSWAVQYQAVQVPAPPPVPEVNGVPQTVTRRQAKQALILAGLWDAAVAAVGAIQDPTQRALMETELYDSQTFERQRPALLQMAQALGLDSTALDNLFIQASQL